MVTTLKQKENKKIQQCTKARVACSSRFTYLYAIIYTKFNNHFTTIEQPCTDSSRCSPTETENAQYAAQ